MTKSSSARQASEDEEFLAFATARTGQLYRSAYFLTGGDAHLSEDLVQETLGRMYTHWGRITRPGRNGRIDNPAGYAQTVMVRSFLSHRRLRRNTERPAEILPDRVTDEADSSLRVTLIEALGRLPARDRAVLVLRYWEDRSVEDTAAALRCSAGAIRTRSSRALAKLRALLGDSLHELAAG